MKTYNGFSSAQRSAAQDWLNAQYRAGKLARPTSCCACPQTRGLFQHHAEDYSKPFTAEKLAVFPLCYLCHMVLHCRFGDGAVPWDIYRDNVRLGYAGPNPTFMNFGIVSSFLANPVRPAGWWTKLREPVSDTVLDQIERGEFLPI